MLTFKLENLTDQLDAQELSFVNWMKDYHSGKSQAITSRHLGVWGKGAMLRRMVHAIRVKGVPMCSCQDGYYFAETKEELEGSIKLLRSYANQIMKAHSGLQYFYARLEK